MIGGGARNKEENRATRPGAGMPSTCGVAKAEGETVSWDRVKGWTCVHGGGVGTGAGAKEKVGTRVE